jgi:hypothetical protein
MPHAGRRSSVILLCRKHLVENIIGLADDVVDDIACAFDFVYQS